MSVQVSSPRRKRSAIDKDEFETLFSSRGTKWSGLTVEKARQLSADSPHDVEATEPLVGYVQPSIEVKWAARGARHRCTFRPGVSVFLNKHYPLYELTATTQEFDAIFVRLERPKIAELLHDDVRLPKVDFLDHVIMNDDQAIGMIGAMYAEARAGSPAGGLLAQSISLALLAHVYDRYDRANAARRFESRLSPRQDEIISRYVRENIGSDLSVTELADLLQLSPAYFCKAFAKTRGVTPHRFVLNERISIAMEKLRQPSAPVLAQLAADLGFANQAHFSNVFRKIVGCSPSEFRSAVR